MIRNKSIGEMTFELKAAGSAATSNYSDYCIAPFDGYITAIYATFGRAGAPYANTTADVRVDIQKQGTSIFAGATTSIIFAQATIATLYRTPTYNAPLVDPTPVNKGDKIGTLVTQILDGTAPTQPLDLSVFIVFSKSLGQSQKGKTLLGKVDSFS